MLCFQAIRNFINLLLEPRIINDLARTGWVSGMASDMPFS